MRKILPAIILILLAVTQAFSQHGSHAYRKHGDTQYHHHHYNSAIDFYQKALVKAPDPAYIMLQLARCYAKSNQPGEAEKWYLQARNNKAALTIADYYQYARILVTLKKRNQADALLEHIVQTDPNNHLARKALSDLRDFEKYYQDSASVLVDTLNINTDVAEFGPAYYKEGIVFTSARSEGILRKKYHWDNTHFLNLYYSPLMSDKKFGMPQLLEDDLSTKYHEGPAVFYNNFKRMIINRNHTINIEGSEDVFEWRLALYDAQYDEGKSTWKVTELPFNEAAYSLAHPSISEDGNTLYFISDIPGGYGGTDIYRIVRTNGVWGRAFNLGPVVNSAENEVFPFFINNTLYFSSTGHGGIGGHDLFTSTQTVNGFTPPENMGYPMNSSGDDLSLITDFNQRSGYFASSRSGNDDLYAFRNLTPDIRIDAHIYDSLTRLPLAGADIQIITNTNKDTTLKADTQGNFDFILPKDTEYVIIGTLGDKIGVLSDIADQSKRNEIPAFADTSRVACIGFIENQHGQPKKATVITIIDKTTGEKIEHPGDQSRITFLGEKGHEYKIEVQDELGVKDVDSLSIAATDKDPKTFTMVLPDPEPVDVSAQVLSGNDNTPLAGVPVTVVTFGEVDKQLKTDADGKINLKMKEGTAFVIIGTTANNLLGIQPGFAQDGTAITVPVTADTDTIKDVIAIGLVTDVSGRPIDGFKPTVTNKKTGEQIPVQSEKGVMTFKGQHGQSYNISVEHEDYLTTLQELLLPENGPDIQKFTVIMEQKPKTQQKLIPVVTAQSVIVADNIKSGKSELLVVDTDKGTSKVFIKSGETLSEVTERDSLLYQQTSRGNEYLGKGLLTNLRTNPSSVLKGVERSDVTRLRNIYFDFDKSNLDPDDMKYLNYVKNILDLDRTSKLLIAGHADDRGTDDYNIKLSRRRTQAVMNFLINAGIPKDRLVLKAYGETLPVVPCHGEECSEEEHQKNRRAEFVLSQDDFIEAPPEPKLSTPEAKKE